MERRFDSRLRKYLSVITLFLSIILDTAGTLYAGGLIVTTFIPGTNLWEGCALLALFTHNSVFWVGALLLAALLNRPALFTAVPEAFDWPAVFGSSVGEVDYPATSFGRVRPILFSLCDPQP